MQALLRKNDVYITVLLLSDDRGFLENICTAITDPTFKIATALLSDAQVLGGYVALNDMIIVHVHQNNFKPLMDLLGSDTLPVLTAKIVVVDADPSPERAVQCMKAGAVDYVSKRSETIDEYADQVEQLCFEAMAPKTVSKLDRDNNERKSLEEMRLNIQNTVLAAKALAQCKTLKDACETLLETIGETLGATGGSLYLKRDGQLERVHSLDPGHASDILCLPLKKGTIFEQAFSSGEAILIADDVEIQSCKLSGWGGYKNNSVLVYPLHERNGEVIGLFSLHGKEKSNFTGQDLDLALILASYSHETIRSLLAQERSNKALDSLQSTFDNMNQGILLLDADGHIIQFNQNVASIIEMPKNSLSIGQKVSALNELLMSRGDLTDKQDGKNSWNDEAGNYEYLHFCVNGTIVKVNGKLLPAGGQVLTLTDITSQKNWESELFQAKEKAEAASVSKTNFLANVSHELRTPLNAIIGFSEMMTKEIYGKLGNTHYEEYARHIHDSGGHLLRLINNLLDLSKVEAGKFQLHMGNVELYSLVDNTGSYFSLQAADAGVSLMLDDMTDFGTYWGDENALRQIFLNLISNAIKFTPRGGSVDVSVENYMNDTIILTVSDTGIGMEEKSIEIAMEPFGQVENAFNRKYPGTGLGLPLVASLSELHGGRLEIESAVGVGTTCKVFLPIAQQPMN
ncbi:MAG: ATP-binding protein [Sneathiella sp.]